MPPGDGTGAGTVLRRKTRTEWCRCARGV